MYSVITTINYPTEAVESLNEKGKLILVFDKKTPINWFIKKPVFEIIALNNQPEFNINKFLPENHYSRKNLGYLSAIKNGASCIYDTDDDNIPNENWRERTLDVRAYKSVSHGWFNPYSYFAHGFIWPRGFSLTKLLTEQLLDIGPIIRDSSIQQGLSDGEPDVDAIWRLTRNQENSFSFNKSIFLKPFTWCPFNSQSTWWFPKAYPLMYLPVTATMRCTDIWRSFIAQRCLWELGEGVTFHSPAEVTQVRNPHDLLKDFELEIPGYLNNDRIVEVLSKLELKPGIENVCDNMISCYKELHNIGIFNMWELRSLNAWLTDIKTIWKP